jgi:transketolase
MSNGPETKSPAKAGLDFPTLQRIADTIRVISAEAVQKANSGHPGLPMGCAEIGAMLYARHLRHNPKNPNWPGRDRFVLSAGHGSMFLYSVLHLSGYDLSLDDLKQFRRFDSRTPGHPEYGVAPGVETTTGPLGQGAAAAAGMAMGRKWLAARFGEKLFDSKVFALLGDGCIMEGITSEASSLAGHLQLNNLVYIYDSNDISLDGPTSENLSEDTAKRYAAYGWRVIKTDGHDFEQIDKAFKTARAEKKRPTIIIAKTTIGRGSPNKGGTNDAHGAPLGEDEVKLVKQGLNWPDEPFHVPAEVRAAFASLQPTFEGYEKSWKRKLSAMKRQDPEKGRLWDVFANKQIPADFDDQIWNMDVTTGKATRSQSHQIIAKVAELAPFFLTGSADLSCSDRSDIKNGGIIGAENWMGRNFKFGVREFAMAASSYGMVLNGMIQPIIGTFFTFSDYMRNAVRLSSIMKQRVFYQFTHDSVFVGEDGPTHEPVEHIAALRTIPGITVIRPCDENELKVAWCRAFKHTDGPVAFVLTRQDYAGTAELTRGKAQEGLPRGGYVLYGEPGAACDVLIAATGSEVCVALGAAKALEQQGKTVRVVSMPCWSYFDAQSAEYRKSVLGGNVGLKVSLEAGVTMGWHKYIGSDGLAIGIDRFGWSAPWKAIAENIGFTPAKIAERIAKALPVGT